MDALTFLKNEHDEVDEMFVEFLSSSEGSEKTRENLAEKICEELDAHAQIEEEIFYPAVREKGGELAELVKEGEEEHAEVKQLIGRIRRSSQDDTLQELVTELAANVRHHVAEEENEMFPKIRAAFDAGSLEDLGLQLEARDKELEK